MDVSSFVRKYATLGLTAGVVAIGVKKLLELIPGIPQVIFSTADINVRQRLQAGVPEAATSGVFKFIEGVGLTLPSAVMMLITAVAVVLIAGLIYEFKPIGKTQYWKLTYLLFLGFGVIGTLAFGLQNGIDIGSMLVVAAVMAGYSAIVALVMTGIYMLDIPGVKAPTLK